MAIFANYPPPTLHSPFPEIFGRGGRRRSALPLNTLQSALLLSIISVISNIADDIGGEAHNTSPPWAHIHADSGADSGILSSGDKRRGVHALPVGHKGDDILARRPVE